MDKHLNAAKKHAHDVLNGIVATRLAHLKNGYSEREMQTWLPQVVQASLHKSDPTAAVPFLSAGKLKNGTVSVGGRDIIVPTETETEYAEAILAKYSAYSVEAGDTIGFRRKWEFVFEACATTEEVAQALELMRLDA